MEPNDIAPPPRPRWPKFALAAVILFLLLAVLWVSAIVRRTRAQGEWNALPGEQPTSSH